MRPLAPLAALSLAACSYFPSHEEVFVPVPLTVGEARIVGADTSWVLAEPAFELVARRRDLLPDARRAVEGAAEQFQAIFGVAPVRVTVALRESPRNREEGEQAAALPAGAAGEEVIPLTVGPALERRGGAPRPRPIPLAPVARAWLSAYADGRAGTPRLRSAYAPDAPPPDDPRLPDWLEDGIVQIVAGSPVRDILLAQLARDRGRALPVRQLLSMPRPASNRAPVPGDEPSASRAEDQRALLGGELEGARLFAIQSYGVARFLAEREGRPMLGAMVDRVIAGETALAALSGAKHLTPDVEMLQREWERWLEEEYGNGPRR